MHNKPLDACAAGIEERTTDNRLPSSVVRCQLSVVLLSLVLVCLSSGVQARGRKWYGALQYADSILSKRYRRANIDTLYIMRPATKWTVAGRLNVSGARIKIDGVQENTRFAEMMSADSKATLSASVNYLGVGLSLALNPAKLMGRYRDYELNLSTYGNRWGAELAYQDAKNFTGWYQSEGQKRVALPADVLSLRTLNLSAYYALNRRRFSYPAAFTQGYIQRRPAGSFLLALAAQAQQAVSHEGHESRLRVVNIGLGAGYGYNFVPGRGWLIHISALPTLICYSHTSLHVGDYRVPIRYHFPEAIVTSRASVVRQMKRVFIGATAVFNLTNIGHEDHLAVHNLKWRTRTFVGYRF